MFSKIKSGFKSHKKLVVILFSSFLILGLSGGIYYFDYFRDSISPNIISKKKPTPTPKLEPLKVSDNNLKKFSSCSTLTSVFENRKKEQQNRLMEFAATAPADPPGKGGGGGEYSETNVQVEGVDEGDIVKTDGDYIYTIVKEKAIKIVKALPANNISLSSTINFPDNYAVKELFLDGNKLVALGNSAIKARGITNVPEWYSDYNFNEVYTFIKIWDITDRNNPNLVRDLQYQGNYSTSRKISSSVYVVVNTAPDFEIINKDAKADQYIPKISTSVGSSQYKPACECQDVHYLTSLNSKKETTEAEDIRNLKDSNFVSVITIKAQDVSADPDKKVIVASTDKAYASAKNLYLAEPQYPELTTNGTVSNLIPDSNNTAIHKFALSAERTDYLSSTIVPGEVLNKYSMDEYNDHLRIATTKGNVWNQTTKSTNNLYVLDKNFKLVGKIEGLAEGEHIYSARFVGERGYLVTFKKVDPFFTLDLKDPASPKVVGQLKIPGYSDYLHPIDENHIIGIGKNTIEAQQELESERRVDFAWYQGIKMAIFDVTDFANPKEMHKVTIGDRGTDSYALHDPKAFLYDKKKNLLVIPILLAEMSETQKKQAEDWEYGANTYQGSYVYNVTLDAGFELRGRVTHYSENHFKDIENNMSYYYYGDDKSIARSLYIGDNLYTVSNGKIMVNNLSNLSKLKELSL
ncbi:MAG: hypothetical protein UT66_C0055G0004 [candidate division CPR2 bacterium GW2011_GWC1_39_9]|uniref:Beta propeller domain protein n=1 Tax=candidate division CPR2 bacterium GW2011_GWC2_39_10 TaxID=1618345 RepID=A0A0G0PYZ1_UNCC2|nr:MAG: hypothetical protein UT18_C0009G0007 [candidate division CPR2 bacterium GW2011_GWC2_39_10]KKR32760.1 MAG: hypothetical protein UT66_C0055G0004 [candidate division CPR2 bacterium GW2011_GWC1_39_9]